MKLLKIVLIALVTVGIYSFTSHEKKSINMPKITLESDGCYTIVFNKEVTEEQKRLARLWINANTGVYLDNLTESINLMGKQQEIWSITITDPTRIGQAEDNDDKDPTTEWYGANKFMSSYNFGCSNSFRTNF